MRGGEPEHNMEAQTVDLLRSGLKNIIKEIKDFKIELKMEFSTFKEDIKRELKRELEDFSRAINRKLTDTAKELATPHGENRGSRNKNMRDGKLLFPSTHECDVGGKCLLLDI